MFSNRIFLLTFLLTVAPLCAHTSTTQPSSASLTVQQIAALRHTHLNAFTGGFLVAGGLTSMIIGAVKVAKYALSTRKNSLTHTALGVGLLLLGYGIVERGSKEGNEAMQEAVRNLLDQQQPLSEDFTLLK